MSEGRLITVLPGYMEGYIGITTWLGGRINWQHCLAVWKGTVAVLPGCMDGYIATITWLYGRVY